MIRSFRHKGLDRFFSKSDRRGLDAKQVDRIGRLLDRLDAAARPGDMSLPSFKFHPLTGSRKGTSAVSVSGNWRITSAFKEGDAINVDLEDYH